MPLKNFMESPVFITIALFTVTVSHLHYNVFERGCEAISGTKCKIARNCLTSTLKNIVMQMRNGNCEKGYYKCFNFNKEVVKLDELFFYPPNM